MLRISDHGAKVKGLFITSQNLSKLSPATLFVVFVRIIEGEYGSNNSAYRQ
jgi:hypothetical protein